MGNSFNAAYFERFMIKNGYQLIDTKSKDLEGLKYIKKDKILKKYYLNFKKMKKVPIKD